MTGGAVGLAGGCSGGAILGLIGAGSSMRGGAGRTGAETAGVSFSGKAGRDGFGILSGSCLRGASAAGCASAAGALRF